MKTNISTPMLAAIRGRVSTMATCWRIERVDGTILGFTSHREDLVWPGEPTVTYQAKGGYTPSAIQSDASLSVDNLELEGLLKDSGITEADIREGVYDFAEVIVFLMDYQAPVNGRIIQRKGNIGELTLKSGVYVTEIRGLAQRLTRITMRTVTPDCDAQLFDTRCALARTSAFYNAGVITAINSQHYEFEFTISGTARTTGFFDAGLVKFISGFGSNRYREVKEHTVSGATHTVRLFVPSAWTLQVGDTLEVEAGCDKKVATCKDRFNNILNFRGFHKVPGTDKLLQYPDYKT